VEDVSMAKYAAFRYNRGDVTKAGRILLDSSQRGTSAFEWAIDVINNWRVAHSYPLNAIAMNLQNRAGRRDVYAVVARRLKRLPSIEAKLRRFRSMRLLQMQDIGGCRAVMKDILDVEQLVADYDESDANRRSHERVAYKDYIHDPKPDGYRSVHLVYAFKGTTPQTRRYDGQMIEVQIRSELQHAWATAVETVDTFTGQALKANAGETAWSRFFSLMGTAIARREQTALVPGTPANERELLAELAALTRELSVVEKLQAWRAAIQLTEQNVVPGANLYLLVLDLERRHLTVRGFSQVEPASAAYSEAEQKTNTNAVLVTVDSIAALPDAYPNYYLHTDLFLNALRSAVHESADMQ
jgi:hypothetical protein